MTIHELKCWPEPFQALMDGRKTCEWRKDDRGYQEGDTLHLMEYEPGHAGEIPDRSYYTSRTLDVLVTDIQRGPSWGIPEGYCMMSVQRVDYITLPLEVRAWRTFDDRTRYCVSLIPYLLETPILTMPGDSALDARAKMLAAFQEVFRLYMGLPENPIDDSKSATPHTPEGGK